MITYRYWNYDQKISIDMNKSATFRLVIGALYVWLFFSISHAQGDNNYDPMINLGCLPETTVMGSFPVGVERGILDDIFWNRVIDDNKTISSWPKYGLLNNSTEVCVIKKSPSWVQITEPTVENCGNRVLTSEVLRRVGKKGNAG